jgi:hypothetical protein
MTHYAALFSLVYMIAFVGVFDCGHKRRRIYRLIASVTLMSAEELERIRRIHSACLEA